ncbi:MAG: hypothetical protein AABY28_00025 [Candidatus Omnitrophota bacterium]
MTELATEKEIHEGKFFALISYIGFLCIISLILKKDNKFALYHAKHGLVLFVLEVVSFILSIIPILGSILRVLGVAAFTLLSLWGILHVLHGNFHRIPVISDIADKIII